MRKSLLAGLVVCAALAWSGGASACNGSNVILADNFADDSGGWEPDPHMKFAAPALVVKLPKGQVALPELNSAFLLRNADVCMDSVMPNAAESNPSYGIMFWATDYQNYHLVMYDAKGKVTMWRKVDGKWLNLYTLDSPAVKGAPGAANTMRVTFNGNLVTTYINGTKVRDQRAQAPTADQRFGFYIQVDKAVEADGGLDFVISNYKITNPPG